MSLVRLAAKRGLPLNQAPSAVEQAQQLAERVAAALNSALNTSATASLALSGGRSPEAFLRLLDQQPVNWGQVRITLVDERWVPETHPDSNAGMIKRCMPNALHSASWYGLFHGGGADQRPEADAQAASEHLRSWLPLDVVVLGMGKDGHCASLFSGQPGLEMRLAPDTPALCEAVSGPNQAQRLTLTGAALRTARLQLLAISGEDKYQRLCGAFDGPATKWPVAAFLAPPLEIFYSPEG